MANFYCKWCGQSFPSVSQLTSNVCGRHPNGVYNKHELYEGSEKSEYTCKWCGQKFPSISNMTSHPCGQNPNGKLHEPAL